MKNILLLLLLIPFSSFAQTDPSLDAIKKKMEAKDFVGAKAELTKIIEANPKSKNAFTLRGRARMALGDYYGAIGDFNFTLEMDSTLADALNYRGEAKINLGDDEGAVADLDKAIKYNSRYGEAYTNRGFAKYNNCLLYTSPSPRD